MKYFIIAIWLCLCMTASVSSMEAIDKIVAIVGNEPILASELAAQIQLIAIQRGIRPQNEQEVLEFQTQVLDDLIAERLLLIEAKKDTLINVTNEQLDQAVNEHIASILAQFPSEEAFLSELTREGLTLRAFQKRLRPEMENQLLKQQLVNMKLSSISISNQEVNEFYEDYRDSIPDQPEAVRLAHILITFQPSGGTEDEVKRRAESIRENAASGADFSTLAITHSDGPTSLAGGDLGFISRDDVIPEFGRIAFNLAPGDISSVFRTEFGFHVVKCETVMGNQAHFRQILLEVIPTSTDSSLSYGLIDSLLAELKAGEDFRELAKVFSADNDTRKAGGELGWFAIEKLPLGFDEAVEHLNEINDVYGPVISDYGLHILKLLEHQEGREISLETDFDQIKNMARQAKTSKMVDQWVEEIREQVYVDIRLFDE